jgi:hypothetical protein
MRNHALVLNADFRLTVDSTVERRLGEAEKS